MRLMLLTLLKLPTFDLAARAVTELHAARRYLTNVLLHMGVSGDDLTIGRFIELLDYFAENPTEYLEFTQCPEQ